MENKVNNSTQLVLSKFDKVMSFDTYAQLKEFATDIVKSELVDLETPQDVIMAMMVAEEIGLKPSTGIFLGKKLTPFTVGCVLRGKALGFDAITSMEKIYAFEDKKGNIKSAVAVDLLTASLLKAGATTKIIHDFAPLHGYADNKGTIYHPRTINWEMFQLINKSTKKEEIDPNKTPVVHINTPVDYFTEIEFCRQVANPDGKTFTDVRHTETVYFNDYKHLHSKSNWTDYPKDMLRTRCLGKGTRFIGNDLVNGAPTVDELLDAGFTPTTEDIPYTEVHDESAQRDVRPDSILTEKDSSK